MAHQVAAAQFPIGHLLKPELRAIAREHNLKTAEKKDSQGICFLGQVPVQDFLERHIPDSPGPIVNAAGKEIGKHRGLHRYTIGQRKGIGLPSNTDHEYFVVVKKDFAANTLHVAFDKPDAPWLYTGEAVARDFTWINRPVSGEQDILARVRYRDKDGVEHEQKARVVCVAANVVETTRLLLNSATERFPNGLANSSDQVGRNYMRHMTGSVYAAFKDPVHMYRGTTMAGIIRDESIHNPRRGFAGGYEMETLSLGLAFMPAS